MRRNVAPEKCTNGGSSEILPLPQRGSLSRLAEARLLTLILHPDTSFGQRENSEPSSVVDLPCQLVRTTQAREGVPLFLFGISVSTVARPRLTYSPLANKKILPCLNECTHIAYLLRFSGRPPVAETSRLRTQRSW
jgi:hypothetical protein